MADEEVQPNEDVEAAEAEAVVEGGDGNPPHSSDSADQPQNVEGAADGADDSADADAEGSDAEASDAVKAEGSDAEEAPKKPVVPGADLEPIALETTENLSAEERARLEAEAEEEQARREAELAAEAAGEDEVPVREPAKLEKDARFQATGKRKSAIARVILSPGDGEITVNGRELAEFFPRPLHQTICKQPLAATGYEGSLNVRVLVHGGGITGQASAVRHGIARALTEIDAELRGDLKRRGYLTRDARVKERRKAGFKKARKRPQFSKR